MLRNAGVRQALARDTETGVSQGKWSGVMRCRHEVSRESCLPTLITVRLIIFGYWKHSTHSSSLGKVNGLNCCYGKNSHHHNVQRTTDFIYKSFVLNAKKGNQLLLNLMTSNLLDIITGVKLRVFVWKLHQQLKVANNYVQTLCSAQFEIISRLANSSRTSWVEEIGMEFKRIINLNF